MKISKQKFSDALNLLRPGLADKEIISQSASFVFHSGRIYTYNDMIAVSVPFESDLEGAVPGGALVKLLDKMKQEDVDVSIVENQLIVKAGNIAAGLRIESEITLPIDELVVPEKWSALPEDFIPALRFCVFSASSDTSKPVLTCIHIVEYHVESCDNYRVTRYFLDKEKMKKPLGNLLIPQSSVASLINYKVKGYGVTDGWAHFESEGIVFSCRTYAEEYPAVEKLLKVSGTKLSLPEGIAEAADRASIFTTGKKQTDEVASIKMQSGGLTIEGMGDGGWYKEKLKSNYKGEPVTFSVNPHFLKEAVGLTDKLIIGKGTLALAGDNFIHVVSLSVTKG